MKSIFSPFQSSVFCCFFVLLPLFTNAMDKPTCPKKPIKIGHAELSPYYEKGAGIAVDVRKELEKRSGCVFEPHEMPRARLWDDIQKGLLDMNGAGVATPEREAFAYFASYTRLKTMAVIKKSLSRKITNSDDILKNENLDIGIIRGIKYGGGKVDRLLEQIRQKSPKRLTEVTSPEQLFNLFKSNRVQIVFAEPVTYSVYFKTLHITDAKTIDLNAQDPVKTVALVLSKASFSEAERLKWRALVDSMRTDGTMRKILQNYAAPRDLDMLVKF